MGRGRPGLVSRYDIPREIYSSALKHGIAIVDIEHAVEHELVAGEADDGKVLYLGSGPSWELAGDRVSAARRRNGDRDPRDAHEADLRVLPPEDGRG